MDLFIIKLSTCYTLPIERDMQGHKKRLCLYSGIVCFGGYSSEILGYIKRCLCPSKLCSLKEWYVGKTIVVLECRLVINFY